MILKDTILLEAVNIARHIGLQAVTRETVACAANCGEGTINYHYKTMEDLRTAVVEYAIEKEVIEVLAQARAVKHPCLGRLSAALKERVAAHIAGK